jgi:hypothetical protein
MKWTVILLALLTARASADEPQPTAPEEATPLPPPGQESGRVDPHDETDSTMRDIAQGALFVPRAVVEIAFAPVRAGVWAFDRYRLMDRYKRLFFDDEYIYGLHPTARIESDYGVTVGGRFVHRDLLGAKEHLSLRAGFGGSFRQTYDGRLRSGDRFGKRITVDLHTQLERRPHESFYGIGNADNVMRAYHRQELERAAIAGDVLALRDLHVAISGALTNLRYSASDEGPAIDEMYDTSQLPGWSGARNVYGEVELRWDRRRVASRLEQRGTFASGTMLSTFVGRAHQLRAGEDYWGYGGDVQQFFQLGVGPRVLFARLHVEAVTGSVDDVAFSQLPELGGPVWLRGYSRGRFRDRAAAVGSLEYAWDLGGYVRASIFTDAGRVFYSFPQWSDMRVGYGASFQLHMKNDLLGTLSIASSIDGGAFFNLSFEPVFELEPRVEQR